MLNTDYAHDNSKSLNSVVNIKSLHDRVASYGDYELSQSSKPRRGRCPPNAKLVDYGIAFVRDKIDDKLCDLLGLHQIFFLYVRSNLANHVRIYSARAYQVHPDTGTPQLFSQGFRHASQCVFGCGVSALERITFDAHD